jgi:hypothetical protein
MKRHSSAAGLTFVLASAKIAFSRWFRSTAVVSGRQPKTTTPARISVSRGGRKQALPPITDPAGEITRLLQNTCTRLGCDSLRSSFPMITSSSSSLEAGNAFVGLEASGSVYQYLADATAEGTRQFVIGGQTTAIDTRYVLPIPKAIELLTACLTRPDPLAATAWERQ